MSNRSALPIGIFDSGIGGLTVASAVRHQLPHESLIYFGDTAHLPYGEKSTAAIQAYAIKICDVLLRRRVKVILIACNSASAAAYDLVREYVGSKAQVFNVIDPTVAHLAKHFAGRRVGLIGTRRTVASNVYQGRLDQTDSDIALQALATPLLAPMIEEGFAQSAISQQVINTYLSDPALAGIEALVLGCTHYPLVRREIVSYYQEQIPVLDAAELVATDLRRWLEVQRLTQPNADALVTQTFYVSDYTPAFERATRLFFGEKVRLQAYPLWE